MICLYFGFGIDFVMRGLRNLFFAKLVWMEREWESERETEWERDRVRERQSERETEWERDWVRERQSERERVRERYWKRQTERKSEAETKRQKDMKERHIERQRDTETSSSF